MRIILPFLMLIIFFGILTGAIIYLSNRLGYFLEFENLKGLYFLFAGITIFMIAGLAIFSNATSSVGSLIYKSAGIIMGFTLYFLISLLIIDGIGLIVKIPKHYHFICIVGITVIIVLYGIWNSFNIRYTNHSIPIQGLTKEIKAVHLSDIHIGHYRGIKFLQQIVAKTNVQKPDVVFITGDLFDGKIRLQPNNLKPLLSLKAPIYFVDGNHDHYSGVKTIKQYLKDIGVNVLENDVANFEGIQIIGLNHMRADSHQSNTHAHNGPVIKDVLPKLNIDPKKPAILLHHSPDGMEYANKEGIDLYLTGHTHAGQLFPVNLINELLFKYNRGLHKFKDTRMLVSEGVGTFGPPMRFGTKSEIIIISLIPIII